VLEAPFYFLQASGQEKPALLNCLNHQTLLIRHGFNNKNNKAQLKTLKKVASIVDMLRVFIF